MTGAWVPPTPKLPKPPWHTPTTRDVEAMKAWVKEWLVVRLAERLNNLYAELCEHGGVDFELNSDDEPIRALFARPTLGDKIDDALNEATEKDQAPIEQLRAKLREVGGDYAKLAPLIKPNRGQGGHRQKKRDFAMERAVEDVHFIRELWRHEYEGHWKRRQPNSGPKPEGNPPFAEEIAAEFHGVDYNTLVERVRAGKNFRRKSTI